MVTFKISTGDIAIDGACIASGYSGSPGYVNDPTACALKDLGPLPTGLYTIGPAMDHPELGPLALPLIPDTQNEMFGRGSFYIHGDNAQKPPQSSSDGCIVTRHSTRAAIDAIIERRLEVSS